MSPLREDGLRRELCLSQGLSLFRDHRWIPIPGWGAQREELEGANRKFVPEISHLTPSGGADYPYKHQRDTLCVRREYQSVSRSIHLSQLRVRTSCSLSLLLTPSSFKDESGESILTYFDEINETLFQAEAQERAVLVHCVQGISRSASVVIAFCMKKYTWSLKESYDYVKARRSVISPNVGFIHQLGEFELQLFPSLSSPTLTVKDVYPDESAILQVS